MKVQIQKLKCKLCNHEWVPRQAKVRICPKCKSVNWDIGRPKNIGITKKKKETSGEDV